MVPAVYQTLEPDQDVILYDGEMRVTKDADSMVGHGTIELEWEPQPRVIFTFDIPPEIEFPLDHGGSILFLRSDD